MTAETRHLPSADLPKVVGHRGAAGHAPENTLASLRAAHELGIEWVEFDVMLTAEGTPVLFHDETLDRTTDGTGRLADRRWEDLRGLDAGSWFGSAFKGQRVPSLHEALALLGRTGMGANVELKPSEGQDATTGVITAKTLQESWPANLPGPLISSFSEKAQARGVLDAGYALRVYTVNDPAQAAGLYAWGVESLFSDYPERLSAP